MIPFYGDPKKDNQTLIGEYRKQIDRFSVTVENPNSTEEQKVKAEQKIKIYRKKILDILEKDERVI